ncbi:MAG TPA: DUF484 family protein [Methylophilus sp.]|nr:DUF484 family protein [Methylophilus sp.]HQQ33682.1 DUF484 family protein [Methylophilus sp.]
MQEEIKDYLKQHPEFFEENASFLADIHLPSPHGSGTISLAERQQLAQRDKINALEERFAELVLNAQENDKIAGKIHAFSVLLQQARNFDAAEQLVSHYLPEEFNITDTYLRIWISPLDDADRKSLVFEPIPETTKSWVLEIHNVYCGGIPSIDIDNWFLEPAASIAVFPLRSNEQVFGFLALSSDNAERFYVGMGTDFLQKLGDHIGAALSRYLVPTTE